MDKQEELKVLDDLIRKKMIELVQGDDTEVLSELTPAINYLRNNAMVADKTKSSVEEDIEKKVKAAAKRRVQGKSK